MKILILGAGIAGVTAAYQLARRGHQVEVIEQSAAPAMACSFANGGQLSYSHAEPWANPAVLPKIPGWMLHPDSPLVFRLRPDPDMFRWGLKFLSNCTPSKAREHTRTLLRLGLYSRDQLHAITEATGIEFNYRKQGILHIFSTEKKLSGAIKQMEYQNTLGGHEVVLSAQECLEREPALAQSTKKLVGGIFAEVDESGDIHMFTEALAKYCEEKLGVTFQYNTRIAWLNTKDDRIVSLDTSSGTIEGDVFVMCLGAYTAPYLKKFGIRLPVYPMKGYSITIPAWEGAPEISLTDSCKKIVYSRLGDKVRAAGTAEFAGYNERIRKVRVTPLLDSIKELFPSANVTQAGKWACLRPQTPDGPPIVGKTHVPNLFLHCGHGTLGWTQSPGTSMLLADIIDGKPTGIDMDGLELSRF